MRSQKNEQARSLFHRAGTASVAVAVDTRPKAIRSRKLYNRKGRAATKAALRACLEA